MGHDLTIVDCSVKRIQQGSLHKLYEIDSSYISFNFSEYSHIWHIRNSHGHTCSTISKQLTKALDECKKNGWCAETPEGMTGWSVDPHVFTYHVQRILKFVNRAGYENYRMVSDQVWHMLPSEYSDSDTDHDTR